jgi:hypothetical protein
VTTIAEEAKMARTLITEFESLKDNWDGYGASGFTQQTCSNARRLIDMIEPDLTKIGIPDIAPNPWGTISFEWESDESVLYLEIGNTQIRGYISIDKNPPTYVHGLVTELNQRILTIIQTAIDAWPSAPVPSVTE